MFSKKKKNIRKVKRALAQLPVTTGLISQFLVSKGITGSPNNPATCPIARYLKQETGVSVLVFPDVTDVDNGIGCATIANPWGVRHFISAFDINYRLQSIDIPRELYTHHE